MFQERQAFSGEVEGCSRKQEMGTDRRGTGKDKHRIPTWPLIKMENEIYTQALSIGNFFRETGACSQHGFLLVMSSAFKGGCGGQGKEKTKTGTFLELRTTKGVGEAKQKLHIAGAPVVGEIANRLCHHLCPLPSSA